MIFFYILFCQVKPVLAENGCTCPPGPRGRRGKRALKGRFRLVHTHSLKYIEFMSICLSICIYVYLYLCLSMCLSFCRPVYLYVWLSVCMSISFCMSVYLYFCVSVWLSICISVNTSICNAQLSYKSCSISILFKNLIL